MYERKQLGSVQAKSETDRNTDMNNMAMQSHCSTVGIKRGLPLRMQYLGSKARFSSWILHEVGKSLPNTDYFVDAFAGTGVVGAAAARNGYKLYANDIQPYSYCILQSMFAQPTAGLSRAIADVDSIGNIPIASLCPSIAQYGAEETDFFSQFRNGNLDWQGYREFCHRAPLVTPTKEYALRKTSEKPYDLFVNYYTNTYFGVRQCVQLDALRKLASEYPENVAYHVMAATLASMTYAVSSTTHLAQYLKPNSLSNAQALISRRSFDIISDVGARLRILNDLKPVSTPDMILNGDFRAAINFVKPDHRYVVYVDPPYFKEHYSRYYHVLDTFFKYDYPMLTYNHRTKCVTSGRYREERITSEFGLKRSVKKAFSDLFDLGASYRTNIVVSYANTSLVQQTDLVSLASSAGYETDIKEITIMHSGQGQPRHNIVTEYLLFCTT